MSLDYNEFDGGIKEQLQVYRTKSAGLFDYLRSRSEGGFDSIQFACYRANYFYRTYGTIPSICLLVKAAAEQEDEYTLKNAGQNLKEELGLIKDGKKSHAALLRFSHNTHGERVFKIPPISLQDSFNSSYILSATQLFRKIQQELYSSHNYIEILAASYAQEEAATEMLNIFLNSFFKPYAFHYRDENEFSEIIEYFTCHLDGLEERHAENAKRCLFGRCNCMNDQGIAIKAIERMLNAQSNMWNELENGLKKLENKTIDSLC
jgi:hypothetical protein